MMNDGFITCDGIKNSSNLINSKSKDAVQSVNTHRRNGIVHCSTDNLLNYSNSSQSNVEFCEKVPSNMCNLTDNDNILLNKFSHRKLFQSSCIELLKTYELFSKVRNSFPEGKQVIDSDNAWVDELDFEPDSSTHDLSKNSKISDKVDTQNEEQISNDEAEHKNNQVIRIKSKRDNKRKTSCSNDIDCHVKRQKITIEQEKNETEEIEDCNKDLNINIISDHENNRIKRNLNKSKQISQIEVKNDKKISNTIATRDELINEQESQIESECLVTSKIICSDVLELFNNEELNEIQDSEHAEPGFLNLLMDDDDVEDDYDHDFKRSSKGSVSSEQSTTDNSFVQPKVVISTTNSNIDIHNSLPLTKTSSISHPTSTLNKESDATISSNKGPSLQTSWESPVAFHFNGYCHKFLDEGNCTRKICKFKHEFPTDLEKKTDMCVEYIARASDIGNLLPAFEEAERFFKFCSYYRTKLIILKKLMHACIRLCPENKENIKFIDRLLDIFKKFKMMNSDIASEYILSCKHEPEKLHNAVVHLFKILNLDRIPISAESQTALYNIFSVDKKDHIKQIDFLSYQCHVCCNLNLPALEKFLQKLSDFLDLCNSNYKSYHTILLKKTIDLLNDVPEKDFQTLGVNKLKKILSVARHLQLSDPKIESRLTSPQLFPTAQNILSIACTKDISTSVLSPSKEPMIPNQQKITASIQNDEFYMLVKIFKMCVNKRKHKLLNFLLHELTNDREKVTERYEKFLKAVFDKQSSGDLNLKEKYIIGQIGSTILLHFSKRKHLELPKILASLYSCNINYSALQDVTFKLLQNKKLSLISTVDKLIFSWNCIAIGIDDCITSGYTFAAFHLITEFDFKNMFEVISSIRQIDINKQRFQMLICLIYAILQREDSNFDHCKILFQDVLKYVNEPLCATILTESCLEDIKCALSLYLAKLFNANLIEYIEDLCAVLIITSGMYLDIAKVGYRGLLIYYSETKNNDKVKSIYSDCIMHNVYPSIKKMPDPFRIPRQVCLLSDWTFFELKPIINNFLEQFFPLLISNKEKSFEQWFSLSFVLEQVPPKTLFKPHSIKGLHDVSSNMKDFIQRVSEVLKEMNLEFELVKEKSLSCLKITPKSLYAKFVKWKDMEKFSEDNPKFHISYVDSKVDFFGNTSQNDISSEGNSDDMKDNDICYPPSKKVRFSQDSESTANIAKNQLQSTKVKEKVKMKKTDGKKLVQKTSMKRKISVDNSPKINLKEVIKKDNISITVKNSSPVSSKTPLQEITSTKLFHFTKLEKEHLRFSVPTDNNVQKANLNGQESSQTDNNIDDEHFSIANNVLEEPSSPEQLTLSSGFSSTNDSDNSNLRSILKSRSKTFINTDSEFKKRKVSGEKSESSSASFLKLDIPMLKFDGKLKIYNFLKSKIMSSENYKAINSPNKLQILENMTSELFEKFILNCGEVEYLNDRKLLKILNDFARKNI